MGGLSSRRWFLTASTALVVALGAASFAIQSPVDPPRPAREAMRYEDFLAAQFQAGHADLTAMTLAHIGGFAERIPAWLASAKQGHSRFSTAPALQRLFQALVTGDAATIEAALRDPDVRGLDIVAEVALGQLSPSSPRWLDEALAMVVDPLILLGRAHVLPVLHANALQRLGPKAKSDLTGRAARELAAAAEWEHALEILQQARRHSGDIEIAAVHEGLLWKGDGEATDAAFHFEEKLLAGLVEGLLPRKYLHVLTPAFRQPL